jgi:hypothetical protein
VKQVRVAKPSIQVPVSQYVNEKGKEQLMLHLRSLLGELPEGDVKGRAAVNKMLNRLSDAASRPRLLDRRGVDKP